MVTKHFFKILFIFIGMIIIGVLGVIFVNSGNSSSPSSAVSSNSAEVAK